MDKKELVDKLRQKQRELGAVSFERINSLTDDEFLSGYNHEGYCEENIMTPQHLAFSIESAKNMHDFMENLRFFYKYNKHKCSIFR